MRDKIAAELWRVESVDCGGPESVAKGRAPEAFENQHPNTRARCFKFADAILAALPGMVPDLVWEGVEEDCFIQCDMGIHSYQLCVMDALERSCDYAWYVVYCQNGLQDAHVNTDHPQTLKAAKAAANTHHRAAIAKSAGWTP